MQLIKLPNGRWVAAREVMQISPSDTTEVKNPKVRVDMTNNDSILIYLKDYQTAQDVADEIAQQVNNATSTP